MKRKFVFIALFLGYQFTMAQKVFEYPIAPKDSIVNKYFNSVIEDPYQWMENPEDTRLSSWLDEQKKLNDKQSRKQLKKQTLLAQISTMYHSVEKSDLKKNIKKHRINKDKYEFEYRNSGYKKTSDLFYREHGTHAYKKLVKIKDFKKGKEDKPIIIGKKLNKDQNIIAIQISHSGSDWSEVHFYNLETAQKLNDTLLYLRGSGGILWRGNDLIYARYKKPEIGMEHLATAKNQALCKHVLGTKQNSDQILYFNPDKTGSKLFTFFKIDNHKIGLNHYLFSGQKIYRALGFIDINSTLANNVHNFVIYPNDPLINIIYEAKFGDTLILKSNWNTPNWNVLMCNINEQNKLTEIVPEYDIALTDVNKLGKKHIACIYNNKGKNTVLFYNINGELIKQQDFPTGKKVNALYENNEDVNYTEFCISSFYHPDLWYQISFDDFSFKPIEEVSVPYKPDDLETKYVTYKSKDGTEIPMYITCLKSTKLNGKNPTLLYGYGGYGITVEPRFNQSITLLLLHGGVLAVPNVRGGGAEGSDWGLAGRRLMKQNAIDDFIAAAEYLIEQKYTNPEKLAIQGGSHGGLLVGATITQRPELFKAAIAEAGVLDVLRFENYTVGGYSTNLKEFGTVTDERDFKNMLSYSPLHNIVDGKKYPNVLLVTGDNDDRVPPLHSYKFLAALQEKGDSESLYQLYLIQGAGHGGALTADEFTKVTLFKYYFLFDELDVVFW